MKSHSDLLAVFEEEEEDEEYYPPLTFLHAAEVSVPTYFNPD